MRCIDARACGDRLDRGVAEAFFVNLGQRRFHNRRCDTLVVTRATATASFAHARSMPVDVIL
jgi:hypothetical protein